MLRSRADVRRGVVVDRVGGGRTRATSGAITRRRSTGWVGRCVCRRTGRPIRIGSWAQEVTVRWFFTPVTPAADHATYSAWRRSAKDRTVPLSVTSPPLTSTLTSRELSWALRRTAASVALFAPVIGAVEVSAMVLATAVTPRRYMTARAAASRWYCQVTVPDRVIAWSRTPALTVSEGTSTAASSMWLAVLARSASVVPDAP